MTGAASVIIPVRDKIEYTKACLTSLRKWDSPALHEVIIIDNGSTPPSEVALDNSDWRKLRIIRNDTPANFSRSCNQGAEIARGACLAFLNNDTEVGEGWLDFLVEEVAKNGGVAGSLLMNPDGTVQQAGMDLAIWRRMYHVGAGIKKFARGDTLLRWGTMAAAMAVPAQLHRRIGGFDEGYFFGVEDWDYSMKVNKAGARVRCVESSQVCHHQSATRRESKDAKRRRETNLRRFESAWKRDIDELTQKYIIDHGLRNKRICLFGTGEAARISYENLGERGVEVTCFAVSAGQAKTSRFYGLPVYEVGEIPCGLCDEVIITSQRVDAFTASTNALNANLKLLPSALAAEDWIPGNVG